MSHMVASRTSEIGLRIALGAERHAVTALVMREALALALVGAVAGVGLALAGGRLVAGFLHGLQPTDPVAVGAAGGMMAQQGQRPSWLGNLLTTIPSHGLAAGTYASSVDSRKSQSITDGTGHGKASGGPGRSSRPPTARGCGEPMSPDGGILRITGMNVRYRPPGKAAL